jgi:uncharacterized protein
MQTKNNIMFIIQQNQDQIKLMGVKRLGLFGSFLYNENDDKSDIDILIEFEQGYKTFDNFLNVAILLEDLFDRPVELVTMEALSPYIGPHILREVEYVPLAA